MMQWLSNAPTAADIDMEINGLHGDYIGGKPQIKYLRYNFPITLDTLNALPSDKVYTEEDVESLIEMSNAENRFDLFDIGYQASDVIKKEHF